MAEFGHKAYIGGGMCIDAWGAGPFVISAGGKSFRFEDSDRFGPHLIKKNGELFDNPWPSERSPFWRAHRIWVRQGRRTEDGVNCIWDEPKPTKYRKIRGAKFIVENGEEDGAYVEIKPLEP
ncbi:MAG: hypothetical protein J0I08_22955 [Rhizobiales bacterium]|nr:hypothetical protein [Hyphomicrobiales bacterium]